VYVFIQYYAILLLILPMRNNRFENVLAIPSEIQSFQIVVEKIYITVFEVNCTQLHQSERARSQTLILHRRVL
jgi:precorrin-6B methylase 1